MSTKPKVIGDGSYGCIHGPSLKCLNNKDVFNKEVNYKNKISKVFYRGDPVDELKEYKTVEKIDPNFKFHLTTPQVCNVSHDKENIKAIQDCDDYIKINDKTQALILEYGGIDLDDLCINIDYLNIDKKKMINDFWISVMSVFLGIKELIKHNYMHFDMKANNILYNIETNKINIIDFGLMKNIDEIVNKSNNDKSSDFSYGYWVYPLEYSFLGINKFNKVKKGYNDEVESLFYTNGRPNGVLRQLFSPTFIPKKYHNKYESELKLFLKENIKGWSHKDFVNKSTKTTDIYGAGIIFSYVLECFEKYMNKNFVNELSDLFFLMLTPNLNMRITIDELITRYSAIIKKYLNYTYTSSTKKSTIIRSATTKSATTKSEKCPEGKERNPKTGRCIKIKTQKKTKKVRQKKDCPEGKERNPKTGRCIKIKVQKECPEGKRRNPKTGRCIKI